MSKKLINFLIPVILTITAILFALGFIHSVSYTLNHLSSYKWFLIGGVAYFVLMCVFFNKNLGYYQTRIHEALHEIFCFIFNRKIESYRASATNGGEVVHYGSSNMFITLAPYTCPILTYALLFVQVMMLNKYAWFGILVGFSFFFHVHAFAKQTRFYQPDIKKYGLYNSTVFIITFLSMNLGVILYAVRLKLWKGFAFYFTDVWNILSGVVS